MATHRPDENPRRNPETPNLEFGPWTKKWGTPDLETLLRRLRKEVEGRRIAVLLSGGLDSAVATAVLKLAGAEPIAVHVTHAWTWPTPRWSARETADALNVPLVEKDITHRLLRELPGAKGRSVCKVCKRIMLRTALQVEKTVATGDTGMDSIAGAAIDIWRRRGTPPEFVQIPKNPVRTEGGRVIRPLVRVHEKDVQRLARALGIRVRRVGELGDLRRGWREGCPLQHLDPHVTVTPELMDQVRDVNLEALLEARKVDARIAVKWPSLRVLTDRPLPPTTLQRILQHALHLRNTEDLSRTRSGPQ